MQSKQTVNCIFLLLRPVIGSSVIAGACRPLQFRLRICTYVIPGRTAADISKSGIYFLFLLCSHLTYLIIITEKVFDYVDFQSSSLGRSYEPYELHTWDPPPFVLKMKTPLGGEAKYLY